MKKLLLFLVMVIGLVACSPPTEITLPDENVEFGNGAVFYKDKPYSGKITANQVSTINSFTGFVTLKETIWMV